MARLLASVTLVMSVCAGVASAAGPYDGSWSGEASGSLASARSAGRCNASMTATVNNNAVAGTVLFGTERRALKGTVATDGTFTGTIGTLAVTGKFAGKSFDGNFTSTSNCGQYRFSMTHS